MTHRTTLAALGLAATPGLAACGSTTHASPTTTACVNPGGVNASGADYDRCAGRQGDRLHLGDVAKSNTETLAIKNESGTGNK